jgi:hypothetical protein
MDDDECRRRHGSEIIFEHDSHLREEENWGKQDSLFSFQQGQLPPPSRPLPFAKMRKRFIISIAASTSFGLTASEEEEAMVLGRVSAVAARQRESLRSVDKRIFHWLAGC